MYKLFHFSCLVNSVVTPVKCLKNNKKFQYVKSPTSDFNPSFLNIPTETRVLKYNFFLSY